MYVPKQTYIYTYRRMYNYMFIYIHTFTYICIYIHHQYVVIETTIYLFKKPQIAIYG